MVILLEKPINHLVAQEFRQLMIEQQRKLIAQHIIVEEAGKILVKHGLITEQALTNFVSRYFPGLKTSEKSWREEAARQAEEEQNRRQGLVDPRTGHVVPIGDEPATGALEQETNSDQVPDLPEHPGGKPEPYELSMPDDPSINDLYAVVGEETVGPIRNALANVFEKHKWKGSGKAAEDLLTQLASDENLQAAMQSFISRA